MHQRIRTIAALKSYCEKHISDLDAVLAKMDEARAKDTLRHFLSSNSAHMQVLCVYAHESERIVKFIGEDTEEEGGAIMTPERKFEILTDEAKRRVLNLNMRLTSRSTSISSNLDEDAERAFWIDLFQALNGGY